MNYLITGAGSGIGRSIAIELASHNNNCYLLGRSEQNLQSTLALLKEGAHKILIADITNASSMQNLIDEHPVLLLDGIMANAGIGGENNFGNEDRWNEIINTNLTGT